MVTSNTTTYAQLKGTDAEFKSARCKLTDSLVTALTTRFSNASEGVIRASRVVKFCTWPTEDSEWQGDRGMMVHFHLHVLNLKLFDKFSLILMDNSGSDCIELRFPL